MHLESDPKVATDLKSILESKEKNPAGNPFIGGKFFQLDDLIIKSQSSVDKKLSKKELIGTTEFNLENLIKLAGNDKEGSYPNLPRWRIKRDMNGISTEMRFPEKYETYQIKEFNEKKKMIEELQHQDSNLEEIKNAMQINSNEDHMKKIDAMEVSDNLKKMIKEKYYRPYNHPDLKSIKIIDKNSSAVLYELFTVIYREKPRYEISPKIPQNPHQPAFTAKVIFFNEVIGYGEGFSKQRAKNTASQNALAIFAPSLAEKLAYQFSTSENQLLNQKEDQFRIPSVEQNFEIELKNKLNKVVAEEPTTTVINPEPIAQETKPNEIFEPAHEESQKEMLFQPFTVEDINTQIELEQIFPIEPKIDENSIPEPKPERKRDLSPIVIEDSEPVKLIEKTSTKPPSPQQKEELKTSYSVEKPKCPIIYDPKKGLLIETAICGGSGESKEALRQKAIEFLIKDIEPLAEELKTVKMNPKSKVNVEFFEKCCKQYLFTKLYMLHCLIENNKADYLDIKASYFNGEYTVYLYSYETGGYYIYRSESYLVCLEMAKYFLIFDLNKKHKTVHDILAEIKKKFESELAEKEKEKLLKAAEKEKALQKETKRPPQEEKNNSKKKKPSTISKENKQSNIITPREKNIEIPHTNKDDQLKRNRMDLEPAKNQISLLESIENQLDFNFDSNNNNKTNLDFLKKETSPYDFGGIDKIEDDIEELFKNAGKNLNIMDEEDENDDLRLF